MIARITWCVCAFALAGLAVACGGEITAKGEGAGGTPRRDSPPEESVCSSPCVAPQVCSAAGVCIDPGTCAHDADCADPSTTCDTRINQCVLDSQCGTQELLASAVSSDVFLSLDRSCSMLGPVGGWRTKTANAGTKYDVAVAALSALLSKNDGRMNFGLGLFPDTSGDSCTQEAAAVPIAKGTELAIDQLLQNSLSTADTLFPDGPCVTNIDTAMQQAAEELGRADGARGRYVVLITDGVQSWNCAVAGGDAGTTKIIENLRQQGIYTFVVGFGSAVDPRQLNVFADAGGKANSDPSVRYYQAEDQASLEAALGKISEQAFGCVFKLQQVPAEMSRIYVYFDRREIHDDATGNDGWRYDAATQTLEFFGQACADLEGGRVADLDIVYGCPKPVDDPGCPGDQIACSQGECPAEHACVSGCCMPIVD